MRKVPKKYCLELQPMEMDTEGIILNAIIIQFQIHIFYLSNRSSKKVYILV